MTKVLQKYYKNITNSIDFFVKILYSLIQGKNIKNGGVKIGNR